MTAQRGPVRSFVAEGASHKLEGQEVGKGSLELGDAGILVRVERLLEGLGPAEHLELAEQATARAQGCQRAARSGHRGEKSAHLERTRTSELHTELAMPTRCEVRATSLGPPSPPIVAESA